MAAPDSARTSRTNNELLGTGGFAAAPAGATDYRRGYLCGMIRGDGHIGSYSYERAAAPHGRTHRFRLALADFEALRAREALPARCCGIATDEFAFAAAARHAAGDAGDPDAGARPGRRDPRS